MKRMYWKMSVDLSRPQVPSMGHHDPLDGYISYKAIQVGLPGGSQVCCLIPLEGWKQKILYTITYSGSCYCSS